MSIAAKVARIAAAGFLTLSACADGEDEGAQGSDAAAVKIIAYEVALTAERRQVDAVGTARARQAATIYPETGGEVISVDFEPGQHVEAGAVLATLENVEERLNVARARVALQDAEQLLARYERIDVPGAISDSQIDAARTAVEAARIDLDLARRALEQRTIRAPFAGYVGIAEIDPGTRVTAQTEITQLDDRDYLYVDFEGPEQIFGLVSEGDTLPMQPFTAAGQTVQAIVKSIGSRIDPQRRSFVVRAEIDNREDDLRPGMSFRVSFEIEGRQYPTVPEAAILWGGDGAYLWAIEDDAAKRMPVTLVARHEGRVLVDAPLKAGDLIIAEGVQKVRSGTPVDAIDRVTGPNGPVSTSSAVSSGSSAQ